MTPREWLKALRMKFAAEQIGQGVSIKRVAFDLHFSQLSNFSREFKRIHGCSPRQFEEMSLLDNEWRLQITNVALGQTIGVFQPGYPSETRCESSL